MARVRRRVALTAAAWLLAQAATLAVAPVLVWRALPALGTSACTCTNGADGMCPMHHPATSRAKVCVIRAVNATSTTALEALFNIVGLTGSSGVPAAPPAHVTPVLVPHTTLQARRSLPDVPPPRA